MTEKQLNELLGRACEIINSLEGYAKEHSHYPDYNKELQKAIDDFFNEVDTLHDKDTGSDLVELERAISPYEKYAMRIKTNPDLEAQDYNTFGNNKI